MKFFFLKFLVTSLLKCGGGVTTTGVMEGRVELIGGCLLKYMRSYTFRTEKTAFLHILIKNSNERK